MNKTAHQATGTRTRSSLPGVAELRIDPERLQRIWALGPAERLAAARRGQFTLGEMLRWAAARKPREVPLVDGEFFFIAALSADSESDDDAGDG